MKRLYAVLLLSVSLLTAGCTRLPDTDRNGAAWEKDWINFGKLLGVEKSAGELVFAEANDALFAGGIYYAVWVAGDALPYTNGEGEEVSLYDAEAFVLVQEFSDNAEAGEAMEEWVALESGYYALGEEKKITCAGQEFSSYTLKPLSESPYHEGVAALTVDGSFAISVELMCQEGAFEDVESVMKGFLDSFHYRAEGR